MDQTNSGAGGAGGRPLAVVTGASSGIGRDHVVAGALKNRLQAVLSEVVPEPAKAELHRKLSEPGSAAR